MLFAAFAAPAAASAPARAAPLTLPDAVQLGLQTNASIRAKQRAYDATRAGETTAGLRPNPTASYLAEQLGSSGVSPQHTDLLDAQRTYRETALEHVRALGNYWNAVYQLEAAIGEPLEP